MSRLVVIERTNDPKASTNKSENKELTVWFGSNMPDKDGYVEEWGACMSKKNFDELSPEIRATYKVISIQ